MTYVKRLVMQGFKSFARKTEIPFENAMNVIVGPNGSGKSNITDALCFVLGRLSIKSIRAAKAANLLFSGNKMYKGSQEAFVELVFDNKENVFALDSSEVSIKRIVRKNGQSIYKINNQTKTRQELLELLSQAGIDPNGFNIILQGEIQSLVKSTPEERRKIIEEVSGISIYETRKHKSLRELEKTEEKLKEVGSVLRERNAYLKNLEKEKQDAVSFQKLEETIKRCKMTLISRSLKEKEKETQGIEKEMEDYFGEIERLKIKIKENNAGIEEIQKKVEEVNRKIQLATSNEQEVLYKDLSDLKAELAGLDVRRENFDNRVVVGNEKISEYKKKVAELEKSISKVQVKSPKIKEHQEQRKVLQKKFDLLEQQRRRFYVLKSEISSLEHQRAEKNKFLIESEKELRLIEQSISGLFEEIKYAKSFEEVSSIRSSTVSRIEVLKSELGKLEKEILKVEKENAILEQEVRRESKLKEDIDGLEICFVCRQKIGKNHKRSICGNADEKIGFSKRRMDENEKSKKDYLEKIDGWRSELDSLNSRLNELDVDELKIKNSIDKKDQINKINVLVGECKSDLEEINDGLSSLGTEFEKIKNVEEEYDRVRMDLSELSFSDIDVDVDISLKRRELNRINLELKAAIRDIEESTVELKKIDSMIFEKNKLFEKKQAYEQELYEKFQKFFEERNELQDRQKVLETDVIGFKHTVNNFDDKVNHVKIQRAQYLAQIDALRSEIKEYGGLEEVSGSIDQIRERLQKAQFRISKVGNVNLKALDVFEKVLEQCEVIRKKVETVEKEKEQIQRIIGEIDRKKKRSFLKTLMAVNDNFSRNFSQLSRKGEVFLELENKKDPFDGGLNILVKVSRGRYFDITSLSGGEKSLVALALIFSIQEYRPYCFYIFDEIDAALDKRNSELLAALIKKYMTTGQYIIITHNDTLITEATNLYGVSMQENLSKVISLKV